MNQTGATGTQSGGQGQGGGSSPASREDKLRLYKASINCNWKSARKILDQKPGLQNEILNEREETALHVVAAATAEPKKMRRFVTKLLGEMTDEKKKSKNKGDYTALYLAAVAGNLEFVKIMVPVDPRTVGPMTVGSSIVELGRGFLGGVKKAVALCGNDDKVDTVDSSTLELGRTLLTIRGSGGKVRRKDMPLHAAALYGKYDIVKYILDHAVTNFGEVGWDEFNRDRFLEKCVEYDMFDIALEIVKKYLRPVSESPVTKPNSIWTNIKSVFPFIHKKENRTFENLIIPSHLNYDGGKVLGILARKPEAFNETETNFVGTEKKSKALELLRLIWGDILKKPMDDIKKALRGPPDSKQDNKTVSGWAVQAIQLRKLISTHVQKMIVGTNNIFLQASQNTGQGVSDQDDNQLCVRLQELISEALVNMHAETQKILKWTPIKQDNTPVSRKEHEAMELQMLIFKHIANMEKNIETIYQAHELKRVFFEHIDEMEKETQKINTKAHETCQVHIIAAELGNTIFLVELINEYPDLIWKLNDNNQSIFHIATKHRYEGIYNLLYDIGATKDLITIYKDPNGNNMLHLVGKIAKQNRLEEVSGAALQMRRELLWFKEVKNMIHPSLREQENNDGLTPHELFRKEHKDLATQGEKWMRGTASQCMVVAALIATIVFAVAFTVPGGYGQNTDKANDQHIGVPVFHTKVTFMVFVAADAFSLTMSCTSILIFLSILTSRFSENDFLESLPTKLNWGLITLFFSITSMMVAFGISFFVLYSKDLLWMPILICVFVVIPVVIYFFLHLPLFIDVFKSMFRMRYLFKPKKHVLYYENPKV